MTAAAVTMREHPRGMAGVRKSADEVAARIARGFRSPWLAGWTRRAIHDARLAGRRGFPEPDEIIWRALFPAVKKDVAFVKDPVNTEFIATADEILCLNPEGYCLRGEDCDGQLVVLGSAALSAGIPIRLRIRRYAGAAQAHITMLYDSAVRGGGPWKSIDPSTDSGICSDAPYEEEFTMDVDTGSIAEPGVFVGLGSPQGTLGDVSDALPADVTAGWLSALADARDSLAHRVARLQAVSAAAAQVRADLGLPQVDATPSGESGFTADRALAWYLGTGTWTAEASRAEQQIISTGIWAVDAMTQALSGKRAIYWNKGDLYIEGKPSDPVRVLMAPGPDGKTLVPTYFDPVTGASLGTVGILPILIGAAAIVAVSIAAAYAIGKVCEALEAKHHDDVIAQVASNQDQLIQQGKMTPEQAAAQSKALADLGRAQQPQPKKPWWEEMPWLTYGAALAGGVVLGGLAFWGLPHLVEAAVASSVAPRRTF